MWRSIIIALALICLGLLGWYAVRKFPGRIESDLQLTAQKLIDAKQLGDVTVRVSQRDLVLQGVVPNAASKEAAGLLVSDLNGVKSLTNQITVAAQASIPPTPAPEHEPSTPTPEPSQPDAGTATAPDTIEPAEVSAEAAPDAGPLDTSPADTAVEAAPEVIAEIAAVEVALTEVTTVDSGGALTPAQCKAIIADMIEGEERISFKSNTGKLTEEGDAKVVQIAGLLARCPTATGVIEGYHDDYGDPDKTKELTQIRAFNVHKRLTDLGMDKTRFRYIGLGYRNMRYRGPGQRLLNQRVEFNITVE